MSLEVPGFMAPCTSDSDGSVSPENPDHYNIIAFHERIIQKRTKHSAEVILSSNVYSPMCSTF